MIDDALITRSGDSLRLKISYLETQIKAINTELAYRRGDGNEFIMAFREPTCQAWIAGESDDETYDMARKTFGEEGVDRVRKIYVRDKSFFDSSLR